MHEAPSRTTKTLPVPVAASSWLSDPRRASPAAAEEVLNGAHERPRIVERRRGHGALLVEERGRLDLARDLGQVGERLLCSHGAEPYSAGVRRRKRRLVQKFLADRGTHLAAMIAYFALLAFVPLTFLALSLLAFTGQADESSFLVREIKQALPETPIEDIVRLVRTRAGQRRRARDRRRGIPRLDRALALQRARVRVQHRLRPAEPPVHPREVARARTARRNARHALRRAPLRFVRRPGAQGLGAGVHRQPHRRVRAVRGGLVARRVRLHPLDLLRAHERAPRRAGRAAGGDLRDGAAGGELPDPADLPALRRAQPGAEGVRLAGDPPRLALLHGERARSSARS